MGPRSCERGNSKAELSDLLKRLASMGPRSCERGNVRLGLARLGLARASMGPRSCERGNAASTGPSRSGTTRFNGAALVRARKCGCDLDQVGFGLLLQWGRARASAEIRQATNSLARPPQTLQWGRARASAEISTTLS